MASSSFITNVPRLKGRENYSEWAFAVSNFLVIENLDKYITSEPTGPTDVVGIASDQKAKAKLILTIDSTLYIHVKQATTAKGLWDKLKSMFDDSGFSRKITLLRYLISIRLENCNSMSSYVNQIVDVAQKLQGTGFAINDEWIGSLLLAGLPEKFSPMIMAIEHSGLEISTDSIKSKLMDFEEELLSKSGTAFALGKTRSRNPSETKSSKKHLNVRCYGCNQVGHYKNKCPQLRNKDGNKHEKAEQKASQAFSAVFMGGSYNQHEWYIDSGASSHFTSKQDCLDSKKNSRRNGKLQVPKIRTENSDSMGKQTSSSGVDVDKEKWKIENSIMLKTMTETEVKQGLKFVLSKIEEACSRRTKEFGDINPRLVAVSKTKPVESIIEAYEAGQRHFGENYVQELEEKAHNKLILEKCKEIKWHFIGHLQGKKVNKIINLPNLYIIETLDSQKLAKRLSNSWTNNEGNSKLRVFIQVNTSGEKEKNGCTPNELINMIQFVKNECPNLQVDGLMTIGAVNHSKESQNPDFVKLVQCKKEVCQKFDILEKDLELSMGMSGDFEHAIEMGSTNVRVGSAIFGYRPNKN